MRGEKLGFLQHLKKPSNYVLAKTTFEQMPNLFSRKKTQRNS
jgi:hypothetical protein